MKATSQKFRFTVDVKALKPGEKINKVMVDIWHSTGGQTLAGTNEARSIWCSVMPIEEQPSGVQILMLTHGMRYQLEAVNRRNDRKMGDHLTTARREFTEKKGKAWDVLQKVLEREQLELI